jgi:hypothetical protein
MVNNNNQILAEVHALKDRDEQIPVELPPFLLSNLSLQLKKQKGNTRKRVLTSAEVSERQQKAITRAQTRAKMICEAQHAQKETAVMSRRHTCS